MLKSLTEPLTGARGFLKALIDTNNNHIIGFTMIGPEAGEVICRADGHARWISLHRSARRDSHASNYGGRPQSTFLGVTR